MRAWKKTEYPVERVFLYFRGHPAKLFATEHVAAQVKLGRRATRSIVASLVEAGKLESIETVSAKKWGRPRVMFRAVRGSADSFLQAELFKKLLRDPAVQVIR